MPLTFFFLPCSSSSSVEVNTRPTTGDPTLLLTTSSSSDTSSSSIPSTSSTASAFFDDSFSLQTFPSLPSLQSLLSTSLTSLSTSTSVLFLSSLIKPLHSAATAVAFSSSPSHHLYSASESEIAVYDLSNLRKIDSFPAPSGAGSVKSVSLSPDGKLFTAHQDGRIRVWKKSARSKQHRLLTSLPTATDRLRRLPLPKSYVTVRRHKKRLWIEHADAVSAVAARGDLLYSVSWDKTLKIWRASDLRCLESVTAHDDAVNAVAVSVDGTVYTGSADRRIRVWGKGPGERRHSLVATLERHRSAVNALAISADGSVLYSGACDRSILVWEREGSANYMVVSGALRGHGKAILCLACVGDLLFSGSSDRTVRIWRRGGDGRGYTCLAVMEGHVRGVRSLAAVRVAAAEEVVEEEYRVCSGGLDGDVRVWQVQVSDPKVFSSDLSSTHRA